MKPVQKQQADKPKQKTGAKRKRLKNNADV
jgi:hypothetical protein